MAPVSEMSDDIRTRVEGAVLRAAFALPRPIRRLLAGRPGEMDRRPLTSGLTCLRP